MAYYSRRKKLLTDYSDPLGRKLNLYQKAVARNMHKMKAFVRFQRHEQNGEEIFIAWHCQDHYITRKVAPFFKKRFFTMNWIIMTPDETILWDKTSLAFTAGVSKQIKKDDAIEELGYTYYKSTFNPARIKLKAMRADEKAGKLRSNEPPSPR